MKTRQNKKKTEERDKSLTRRRLWNGSIVAALVTAIVVFGVMLQIEKNTLTQYEKGSIFVAAKEIPKGKLLTEENYEEYLTERMLDKSCIPSTAISRKEQIKDLVAAGRIEEGVLLTKGMFESVNEITEGMKEPVIAGFRVEDLYQAVGGTLRAGDRIHIYNLNEEGVAEAIWSNVYVQEVFDSAGVKIESGDSGSSAQRINVYMDHKDIERFYSELAVGTLRVVKVCD